MVTESWCDVGDGAADDGPDDAAGGPFACSGRRERVAPLRTSMLGLNAGPGVAEAAALPGGAEEPAAFALPLAVLYTTCGMAPLVDTMAGHSAGGGGGL